MVDQPSFGIEVSIATDAQHVREQVPPWCEVILDVEKRPTKAEKKQGKDVELSRLFLTRNAGEAVSGALHEAMHPHAGKSLLEGLWLELDTVIRRLIAKEPEPDDKGYAKGLTWAIAHFINPYQPDYEGIKQQALRRARLERSD